MGSSQSSQTNVPTTIPTTTITTKSAREISINKSKKISNNVIKLQSSNKKLQHEQAQHDNMEEKLNIYSNFYDNYNNKLIENINDLTKDRKTVNENYYRDLNIYKFLDNKLKTTLRNLYILLCVVILLLILTFFLSSKVLKSV